MAPDPFNLIPPCLRNADTVLNLRSCLLGLDADGDSTRPPGVLLYWLNLLFGLAALISFFYLLYGALQLMTAFGNEAKYTQGKNTILYALIGFIVAVLANLIILAAIDLFSGMPRPPAP